MTKYILCQLFCLILSVSCTYSQGFITSWVSHVGGPSFDHSIASCIDHDNNVYHLGTFSDSVTFNNTESTLYSNGRTDFYLIKYDANGNIIWKTSFGGSDYDGAAGIAVIQLNVTPLPSGIKVDALNNVYIFGNFRDTVDFDPGISTFNLVSDGLSSGFLLKLNSDGEFVFAHKFDNAYLSAFDVNSNGIYLSGSISSIADIDPGPGEYLIVSDSCFNNFISSFSLDGDFEQAVQLLGSDFVGINHLVADVNSQAVYLTGVYQDNLSFDTSVVNNETLQNNSAESTDGFIAKISMGLDTLNWIKQINSTNICSVMGLSVLTSTEIIVSGHFRESINFDLLEGDTVLYSDGLRDVFVLKINPNGEVEKVLKFGNTESSFSKALNIDNDNNIYLATTQEANQEVNFSNETITFQHQGLRSSVLLMMDEDINYLNHFSFFGGDFIGILSNVTFGLNNEVYLNAYFSDNPITSYNPSSELAYFEGRFDGMIFKVILDKHVNTASPIEKNNFLEIFPNPISNQLNIRNSTLKGKFQVNILDATGRIIHNEQFSGIGTHTLNLSSLAQGIYYCRILQGNEVIVVEKVIKF